MQEDLSPLLKSVFICSYALEAIQKPIESSPNFSKEKRVPTSLVPTPFFKNCERILVYSSTNREKSTNNPGKNSADREKESIR